ncbi:ribonuclease H-like domain-containing protein [Tanacetum coccineum]
MDELYKDGIWKNGTTNPSPSLGEGLYTSYYGRPMGSNGLPMGLVKSRNLDSTRDHAVVDSGCSSHMTGNKAYLSDYEDFNRGFVAFGSDPKGGKITGKGKIKTANLDFDDVYFVDELKFNLFSVLQMCDKKNSVLFTESECLILSPSFKLLDESQVVLRAPRKDDVYSLDLKNIVPSGGLEKQLNHNVKIIRCDNGTKFKNHAMNEFCTKKGIKREFSVARTPQQNGVTERKNKTLIEAARTMLADSLVPISFWAEAVNTACYVLNRVLVTKPQNKTPYELLIGKSPSISFMRPFGCSLTILNTLDSLGKFDGKSDEGYLLGYSTSSNTSGSTEDIMQLKELMDIVPRLVTRIETLETELQQTKITYGKAVLTLVKRVKILEKALKRKTQKVVISESEGEELEDQGRITQNIDDDPLVSLVRESMRINEKSTDFVTPTKASGEAQEEDISPIMRRARLVAKNINTGLDVEEEINIGRVEINTSIEEVSTGSAKVNSGTASKRGQREEKAPMVEEDIQATHKTKEQIRQKEAGLEEAIKKFQSRFI